MDNIKKIQILDKFSKKLKTYDWETNNGHYFTYENDKLRFRLSNYELHIEYVEIDGKNQTGFKFSLSDYEEIHKIYMDMCDDALDNALEEVLNAEPDIKRELGLEELLDE